MSPPPPRTHIRPMSVPNRYRHLPFDNTGYRYPALYSTGVGGWMTNNPLPPTLTAPTTTAALVKEDEWICDYCNSASFTCYKEACAHEEICKRSLDKETRDEAPDITWCSGSIPLCVPASDSEWLSTANCYIRQHCVEAFSASDDNVSKTSKRGRIAVQQVGIRCTFCAHRPLGDRAAAAVSYPTSVAGIYESVKRWQRVHLELCQDVPVQHKDALTELHSGNLWIPTTRQYWSDSAMALGMVDTSDGIRFAREPSVPENWTPDETMKDEATIAKSSTTVPDSNESREDEANYICLPTDQELVPPYVYFLLRQVEPCKFSESDRFVARSKGPLGFAGFQCKHCAGHAGLGKYFPTSSTSLGTNSTSQNIHAHILKCRKVPDSVKEELVSLKEEKGRSPRLVPGWRKTFFDLLWTRIHGEE